jgi:hypothetical protein
LHGGFPKAQLFKQFSSWEAAFRSIAEMPFDRKKLLIIDEFPYMVRGNSAVPSMLQKAWDEELKDKDVMIILCGSAMSFIERDILAEKNPLYGRATGILKMHPMPFYDVVQFVPNYSIKDKITTYAVLGGIPHYLTQFDDSLPLGENIKKHILSSNSILYNEVEFLMRQELRETAIYNAIIEAVALGNTKLNGIHQKTQIEKTKLTAYLRNLTGLNILRRELPILRGVKERANVQRGLYRVTDNFFLFWYAFVFPNISELETGDFEGIWTHIVLPGLDTYTSYVFEDICIQYLRIQNRRNALPFFFTGVGRWWDKDREIDIVAVDATKQNLMLCECKWTNEKVDVGVLNSLVERGSLFGNVSVQYIFFAKSGFTSGCVDKARDMGNVSLVPLDEIFFV